MKGQYFSFDAIIASVIFVMALVALLSYWHSVKAYLDYQNDGLSTEAIRVSNLLFTPPSPSSSCDSMNRFGLSVSWDDRRLDSSILSCAEGKDSVWLQSELGSAYPVMMNITRLDTNQVVTIGSFNPSSTTPDVVKIRRAATVINQTSGETYPVDIDLILYNH